MTQAHPLVFWRARSAIRPGPTAAYGKFFGWEVTAGELTPCGELPRALPRPPVKGITITPREKRNRTGPVIIAPGELRFAIVHIPLGRDSRAQEVLGMSTAVAARSLDWFVDHVQELMRAKGYPLIDEATAASANEGVVLHRVDAQQPRSFRRKNRGIFVVGIGEAAAAPAEPLRAGYPLLIHSLSNLFVLYIPRGRNGLPEAYFFTLEQGYYSVPNNGDDDAFFEAVVERIGPLATSRLIIQNEFIPDLPEELWNGDEHTAAVARAGRRADELDVLPAPFPVQDYVSPQDWRNIQRLYGLGGLSYCNFSERRDALTFWMSASGVDKSKLEKIGEHILLVKDYDPSKPAMILSVPPHVTPKRVSVDAIEHWMIYREHPSVGAILHVHAWMEGAVSTHINYPCGTEELASSVASLVRQAPDPGHAVIGLKNHGLTITGESLDEIFDRVEDKLLRQVPMT